MNPDYTVFIVDDDVAVRDALGLLLGVNGYRIAPFADADSFLAAWCEDWQGCLLLDLRMPGMDGLSLQRCLRERGCQLPVIVMTGHGDVESARAAFRADAVDFLEKPVDEARLLGAVAEALRHVGARVGRQRTEQQFRQLEAGLTPREREVMRLVVAGRHNREIAQELNISVRTVEVHKARMMDKLQVATLPDLVRLAGG